MQRGIASLSGISSAQYGIVSGTVEVAISQVNLSKTYIAPHTFALTVMDSSLGNVSANVGAGITNVAYQEDKIVISYQYNRGSGYCGDRVFTTQITGEWQLIEFY